MNHNYGNEISRYQTKKGTLTALKVWAVIALVLFGVLGLIMLIAFDDDDPDRLILVFVFLGAAVFFFMFLHIITRKIKSEVIIFEEGVAIKNGRREHFFHYTEIAGLRDNYVHNAYGAPAIGGNTGGILGALIANAAIGAVNNAADSNMRKNKLRNISVIPSAGGFKAAVNVINTGGEELTQRYTDWLIRCIPVTKDNVCSLDLYFGDKLSLNQGTFIHSKRKGDVRFTMADVTALSFRDGFLWFNGVNENGKPKVYMSIDINKILNMNLLYYVYDLSRK